MQKFLRDAISPICLGLLFAVCCRGEDRTSAEYQKQQEKLSRETSSIGRTKVLIKMSDLDMNEAGHWVKKGNLLEADRFLNRYTEVIKQTSQVLKGSNRNAQKNPVGFKDFEIALRRQLRKLVDLKPSYPFDQQEAIDQAITTAESAKEQMIQAIFGPENAGRGKDRSERTEKSKEETP